MSKYTDSILQSREAYAGTTSASLNLEHGGQFGYMASIGGWDTDGSNVEAWINAQPYISNNVIPIVITYPKFLDFMPDSDKWIAAYKALIELHPQSIDGLSSGLTVEFDETAIGGAGEVLEEITDVKRARSNPVHVYKEKANKTIQKFLDTLIRYGYKDPDVKKPLVVNLIENVNDIPDIYSPDFYSGTTLYIEPDILHKSVVDAWLCMGMKVKGNGDRTGKRNLTEAGAGLELSIEFTSITMTNASVLDLASVILSDLDVLTRKPDNEMVLPTWEVDSKIKGSYSGYNDQ